MFLVKCPKCNNTMKYNTSGSPKGKKKRCVYCGRSFTVHTSPTKSTIIKEL